MTPGFNKLLLTTHRVRTLTGKEIELDIEPDYKVRSYPPTTTPQLSVCLWSSIDGVAEKPLHLGIPHKRTSGGERGNTTSATAFDFWWETNVSFGVPEWLVLLPRAEYGG